MFRTNPLILPYLEIHIFKQGVGGYGSQLTSRYIYVIASGNSE